MARGAWSLSLPSSAASDCRLPGFFRSMTCRGKKKSGSRAAPAHLFCCNGGRLN
jgi:hypothetical protein